MLIFEHYLYAAFRISKNYYGEVNNQSVEIDQDIYFSRDMCRDKSGLIIRVPKKEELGVIIKASIRNNQLQELLIRFVDNIDFNTDGENVQEKM